MNEVFDHKGFSAEKLEALCSEENVNKGRSPWLYWTSECYSSGKFLREYGCYPSFLPLNCYSNHGVGVNVITYPHEIDNDAAFHLVYDVDKIHDFKKYSDKPCYPIVAPFPWLRKKNNWHKSKTAKGTLAFFQHTTPQIGFVKPAENIVARYVDYLLQLPQELHPICVCLHMHDINNGTYKYFLEKGIPVYTAGAVKDIRFAERFYAILNNFSYSTGSILGSNSWYSVEAGIPFFIYGEEETYYNIDDPNLEKGVYTSYKTEEVEENTELFLKIENSVTFEQKRRADKFLGVSSSISRAKLSFLLYFSFIKIFFKKSFYSLIIKKITKKI